MELRLATLEGRTSAPLRRLCGTTQNGQRCVGILQSEEDGVGAFLRPVATHGVSQQ